MVQQNGCFLKELGDPIVVKHVEMMVLGKDKSYDFRLIMLMGTQQKMILPT